MPTKMEGLLDHGAMEDVKLDSATWKPVRITRWSLDMVRPEFFALRPGSCLYGFPPPQPTMGA